MPPEAPVLRQSIRFYGRVQGVGFRYTTQQIAARYPLTGFVENLTDGSVQLVVEGEQSEMAPFLAELERSLGRFIDRRETEEQTATGEFPTFSIRR